MEAAREAVRLVSLPHQAQLPRMFRVFRPHVLDVDLDKEGGTGGRLIYIHHGDSDKSF